MSKKLGSIAKEKADCIAAFRRHPKSRYVWCCHHQKLFEANRGFMKRIRFISKDKPLDEQASRFRSFRPVKLKSVSLALAKSNRAKMWSDNYWESIRALNVELGKLNRRLFNKEWPNNTWNGRWVQGT